LLIVSSVGSFNFQELEIDFSCEAGNATVLHLILPVNIPKEQVAILLTGNRPRTHVSSPNTETTPIPNFLDSIHFESGRLASRIVFLYDS